MSKLLKRFWNLRIVPLFFCSVFVSYFLDYEKMFEKCLLKIIMKNQGEGYKY